MTSLTLTDKEIAFLYGMLHRIAYERSPSRRYRRQQTEAERLSQHMVTTVKGKLGRAMPKGAIEAIETINAGLMV